MPKWNADDRFCVIQNFHVIFDFTFCEMLEGLAHRLLKHFLEVRVCVTSRGQALAETCILSLTSGDAFLGKGFRAMLECYDRCTTPLKVPSGGLAYVRLYWARV